MSRRRAFSILPSTCFRLVLPDNLTVESLMIPPTRHRRVLWWWYVGSCVASWAIFLVAILVPAQ